MMGDELLLGKFEEVHCELVISMYLPSDLVYDSTLTLVRYE